MKISKPKRLITRLSIISLLGLVSAAMLLSSPRTPSTYPVPSPNGYADFVEAGRLVERVPWAPVFRSMDVEQASAEELRRYISQCGEAMGLVHAGLAKRCPVPVRLTKTFMADDRQSLARLKALTWFVVAKIRLAAMEGRTNEAIDVFLLGWQLTRRAAQGGLMLDYLAGIGRDYLLLSNFKPLIPGLNAEECERIIRTIEDVERGSEKARAFLRRTDEWQDAVFGAAAHRKAEIWLWARTVGEICRFRSLRPLQKLPSRVVLGRQEQHETAIQDVLGKLREQRARPSGKGNSA